MAEIEFVRSLDRGLAVLQAFSAESPVMTISEIAQATDLTRATARRLLHTLEQLNFLRAEGRGFSLTPKVLTLGYAYISAQGVGPIATPHVRALAQAINEAVTVATLLENGYVVIARAESARRLTVPATIGVVRREMHGSSLGKVLMAGLSEPELTALLERTTFTKRTERTITDPTKFRQHLAEVRERGWATSNEEIEEGLISVGAPICRGDQVVAAINTASHAGRTSMSAMIKDVLPQLLKAAQAINEDLALTP